MNDLIPLAKTRTVRLRRHLPNLASPPRLAIGVNGYVCFEAMVAVSPAGDRIEVRVGCRDVRLTIDIESPSHDGPVADGRSPDSLPPPITWRIVMVAGKRRSFRSRDEASCVTLPTPSGADGDGFIPLAQ